MKAALLTLLTTGLMTFSILIIVGRQKLFNHATYSVLFFLFYFVDNLSLALTNLFPRLQIVPNHIWGGFLVCSWSGKVYSLLVVLVLICAFRPLFSMQGLGMSIRQKEGSFLPSVGTVLFVATWSTFSASNLPDGKLDFQTLAYLAVRPGLNEELVYRGVLTACLDKIFSQKWMLASAGIGWSTLITTLLFGLLHGLWFDNQIQLHIELLWIRNALLSGFIFAWLRERTGSLIMPVIAHGIWDFFYFFFRMI